MVNTKLSFWKGRRVLVTGHTGFKGSWLTLWLLSLGAEVWGVALEPAEKQNLFKEIKLDRQKPEIYPGELNHNIADIRDLSSLRSIVQQANPEIVFHLAAQPLVRESYKNPLQTWDINLMGSLNLMEVLRSIKHPCAVVMITTDKVYLNQEWDNGYRETDRLGGKDPYSASKAALELAISSWRDSFCGSKQNQTELLYIASARSGNVVGGGDWAKDRIVPDIIRALSAGENVSIRSPKATRPWQHVLEPLSGYLLLAEKLYCNPASYSGAYNFGPNVNANRSVEKLIEQVFIHWDGEWTDCSTSLNPHEAERLHLQIDKSYHQLGWKPLWSFESTIERTVKWYKAVSQGSQPLKCCLADLNDYQGMMTRVF